MGQDDGDPSRSEQLGHGAIVSERTAKRTADLIADAAKNGKSADARKVGDYYASFMDEPAIEAKGLEPIKAALAMTAAIGDAKSLARALGGSVRADVDVLTRARSTRRTSSGSGSRRISTIRRSTRRSSSRAGSRFRIATTTSARSRG